AAERAVALESLRAVYGKLSSLAGPFFEPPQHDRMVDAILSHFSKRRPLASDNREEAGFGDRDRVFSRKYRGARSLAGIDQGTNAGKDTEDIRAVRTFGQVITGGLENELDLTFHGSRFKRDGGRRSIRSADQGVSVPRDRKH